MSFEIVKDIPAVAKAPSRAKYPFSEMEVGDSFRLSIEFRNSVAAAAVYEARKRGTKYRVVRDPTSTSATDYICQRIL